MNSGNSAVQGTLAIECRLCNCKTLSSPTKSCPNLAMHLIQLNDNPLVKRLPQRRTHRIKQKIREQRPEDQRDLCMACCMVDLISFYNDCSDPLSEHSLYQQREQPLKVGMSAIEAIRISQRTGCTTEQGYEQFCKCMIDTDESDLIERSKQLTDLPSYYLNQEYGLVYSLLGLRLALAYLGPCLLILPCHRNYGKFWMPKAKDTNNNNKVKPPLFHSVLVCGFQPGGFILRNCWSTNWGNKGYGFLSEDDWVKYHRQCWYFCSSRALLQALRFIKIG